MTRREGHDGGAGSLGATQAILGVAASNRAVQTWHDPADQVRSLQVCVKDIRKRQDSGSEG